MRKMLLLLLSCVALAQPAAFAAEREDFSFAVISPPWKGATAETAQHAAIEDTDADNLAFVVANGIKAADEPCTDRIYLQRKSLLQSAKNGLVVSLAASDWADCRSESGKPSAIGKLNRLRDLFFGDEFSIGASRIPVIRQSTTAQFRGFPENARWAIGGVMFATVNLPRNNNHYVFDAGRNGEFEDRLVADRDWLQRIFMHAKQDRLDGIVLFCDGNPLARPDGPGRKRDGFLEIRRQIGSLAAKYHGEVLIVHGAATASLASLRINWRDNIGEIGAAPGVLKLAVSHSRPPLFSIVTTEPAQARNTHH